MSARGWGWAVVISGTTLAAVVGCGWFLWREGQAIEAERIAAGRPTLQEQLDERYELGRRKRFAEVEVLERAAAELGARGARLECYDAAVARLEAAEARLAAGGRRAGGAAWLAARRELAACRKVDDGRATR